MIRACSSAVGLLALSLLVATVPEAPARAAPRSILDLQPYRTVADSHEADGTPIRLIDLNPTVGRWYLLGVGAGTTARWLHLETPDGVTLRLGAKPGELVASNGTDTRSCAVDASDGPIAAARAELPYAPACGGALWVREPARGHRTLLEAATDALRLTGAAGEMLINFYKNNFNHTAEAASYEVAESARRHAADAPPPAVLAQGWANRTAAPDQLGIPLEAPPPGGMRLGSWYAARGIPGVFAAVLTAEAAGAAHEPGHANMAYFVAWDMNRYALRYALGGTHPELGWSERAPAPHIGPGPDGFDSTGPIARVGMVPPYDRNLIAGTFAGGFKREHGAFKTGENVGLHYGFGEDGVVFSTLEPNMVTVYAGLDGMPHIRTFTVEDAKKGAAGLLVARQAGYALVENDKLGAHVGDINGNWSGSNEGHLLTMRGGACVLPANGTTYLVYGVFSAATPKAMAVTFRAFGCQSAALLDMNSPVLVYGAAYRVDRGKVEAEHLMKSMSHADDGRKLKFVDEPDSRDFFYLIRRDGE